jgi:hypothetical protein
MSFSLNLNVHGVFKGVALGVATHVHPPLISAIFHTKNTYKPTVDIGFKLILRKSATPL